MKTLKIKKPEADIGSADSTKPAEEIVNPQQEGIFVSSRHKNPLAADNAAPVKRENWTWAAILSICSLVLFLVLVIILFLDSGELALA